MNWNKIVLLATLLFVAQVVLGFVEGALQSPDSGASWLFAGHATSFVVCSAIAFFAVRYPAKPFAHAWLGLLLQVLVAAGLSAVLTAWLGSTPWVSVALEWAVLVVALVAGTSVGIGLRHSASGPADA
ncbi:hypothetical protein [Luteimonas salinilitoris]|uniref:Uncharacterized protein n=1 Tax=Luteimonas salinilitoris TaxID=3237697 RepID=A0ABV4HVX9_9GAMM